MTNPQKIRVYLHSYMAFHTQFDCINFRIVDKALWVFGKFLKSGAQLPKHAFSGN